MAQDSKQAIGQASSIAAIAQGHHHQKSPASAASTAAKATIPWAIWLIP